MAKIIKAKKSHLFILNKLMAKVPKQSMEESSVKIMNFFRAVKKPLRKALDESAEITKLVDVKLVDIRKEYADFDREVKKLEEAKDLTLADTMRLEQLRLSMKAVAAKGDGMVVEENKQLKAIQDDLNTKEAESVFNNEDFIFVESIFKKNPSLFNVGPEGKEQYDMETMDIVYSMFDNAKSPESKE